MFLYTVPTQTTHIHTEVTTINDSMRQTPRKDKKKTDCNTKPHKQTLKTNMKSFGAKNTILMTISNPKVREKN